MYKYSAYGLTIGSVIPLLEFLPGIGEPDVVVTYGCGSGWSDPFQEQEHHIEVSPNITRFWFIEAGEFVVRAGNLIEIIPIPGKDETLLRLYVQGMMMAMVLYQRGNCVLHSSVVKVPGGAVAFLGHVGAGKSTVAASFHARGYSLISDDNAALRWDTSGVTVAPAYPFVKLYPDIAEAVGYSPEDLQCLHSSVSKFAGRAKGGFSHERVPLRQLYVLSRETEPGIHSLDESSAVLQIIRNSVPTRWGHRADGAHLAQCVKLASCLPAFVVRTFDSLPGLPHLLDEIEEHFLKTEHFGTTSGGGVLAANSVAARLNAAQV